MSRDLSLSSEQYEWLLTAFYITYILFEWATLLLGFPHFYPVCFEYIKYFPQSPFNLLL